MFNFFSPVLPIANRLIWSTRETPPQPAIGLLGITGPPLTSIRLYVLIFFKYFHLALFYAELTVQPPISQKEGPNSVVLEYKRQFLIKKNWVDFHLDRYIIYNTTQYNIKVFRSISQRISRPTSIEKQNQLQVVCINLLLSARNRIDS